MLSPGRGVVAVSESEMKVTLNGTNVLEMPLPDFMRVGQEGARNSNPRFV
jgi:hypothetical protein